MLPRKSVVIVEGLIGVGKSTLSEELGRALGPNTLTLLEPDEKDNANPYLSDFYADKLLMDHGGNWSAANDKLRKCASEMDYNIASATDHLFDNYGLYRYGFTMQVHLLGMRYRQQLYAQQHAMAGAGHAVLDRSFYGDTCFARMLNKGGFMDDREFATYELLYHAMKAHVLYPNVCVRVLGDPKQAAARIEKRRATRPGRESEKAIDLGYLQALDVEISATVDVLRKQGVLIFDVPWDADRETPEQRSATVEALASRISSYEPTDKYFDTHKRAL